MEYDSTLMTCRGLQPLLLGGGEGWLGGMRRLSVESRRRDGLPGHAIEPDTQLRVEVVALAGHATIREDGLHVCRINERQTRDGQQKLLLRDDHWGGLLGSEGGKDALRPRGVERAAHRRVTRERGRSEAWVT